MERYSIYIWLLVLAGLATGVIPFVSDMWLAQHYGAGEIPNIVLTKFKSYAAFIAIIENIISAVWLMNVSGKSINIRLAWSLFGLVYGLWALAIYYLVSIHVKLSNGSIYNRTSNSPSESK